MDYFIPKNNVTSNSQCIIVEKVRMQTMSVVKRRILRWKYVFINKEVTTKVIREITSSYGVEFENMFRDTEGENKRYD